MHSTWEAAVHTSWSIGHIVHAHAAVMLLPLLRVGQNHPSLIDFLEHLFCPGFLFWRLVVLIRMPLQGCLSICCLDGLLVCVFGHAQDFVVVFIAGRLSLLLSELELLLHLEAIRIDSSSRAVVGHRFLPLLQVLVNFSTLHQCLWILGLHF